MSEEMNPTVSVVMPAYNAEKYLREAIDSILCQTYTDFEFIIVNDGSTDGTKDIILSYDDPRIVYIENEQNSGICVTLNKGLDAARGRYIARMDADDISLPERLAVQVEFMDAHPEVGVAGTGIKIFYSDDPEVNNSILYDTDPLRCRANLIFSACVAHPTVIMRLSILNNNGLRYDDYYRGMEDHHLWWQVSKCSQISNVPKILLLYRQHISQVTRQSTNEEFKYRLRSFIRKRVCDCGAILNKSEYYAFYLYHENVQAYDTKTIRHFISACRKILSALRRKNVNYLSAQKTVFSLAICYSLDNSTIKQIDSIRFQLYALWNGAIKIEIFFKRMAHLVLPLNGNKNRSIDNVDSGSKINLKHKKRVAFTMYYMHCGGVESALISLLNKIDYRKYIVDLYLVEAKGEFLQRIHPEVNIINLSNILQPLQKDLIVSENIHTIIGRDHKYGSRLKAIKNVILYAFFKKRGYEFAIYKAASIKKKIFDIEYDIIFDFHGYASFTTYFSAFILKGKKKYTWCHSQNISFERIKNSIEQFNKMFVVSAEMLSMQKQNITIPIEVFFNFIDENKIIESAVRGNRLDKVPGCINLLTVGRLSIPKGYDTAIEVAKRLKEKGILFKWYFCGDGEEKDLLVSLVKDYNLEENIIFLGFHQNPYGFMASCDIYIQPSKWEGYAVTLMEAKLLHNVIISTNVSGAKDAVRNGVDGFICSQDYDEIASKIELLVSNQHLLEEMRNAATTNGYFQESNEKVFNSIFNNDE